MVDCRDCVNHDEWPRDAESPSYTVFFCAAWDEFGTLELMSKLECVDFMERDDRSMEQRVRELVEADAGGFKART